MSPIISGSKREKYLQDRREHILDAAIQVFENKGFIGAGVAEIASVAGIAKGTIYLYFESKENIFTSILNERSFIPILTDLLTDDQPLEKTLRNIAESYFEYMQKNLFFFIVAISDSLNFPECAKQIYKETVLKGNIILSNYLEKQGKSGKIYPLEKPFLAARAFMGMLLSHFIAQEILKGKDINPIEQKDWIDEVVHIFLAHIITNMDV